jgi:hypothetical protein
MENSTEPTAASQAKGPKKKVNLGQIFKRVLEGLVALAVVGGIVYAALPKAVPVESSRVDRR